jgi:lipoate-protein ligase A
MEFNIPSLSKPRWRLLFVPPRDGAENMARDSALQDYSRSTGECVLSVYSWVRPTLSLGRNQTAKGLYDLERIAAEGIDLVRRPTGGRAILHDHEITYSVSGPDSFAPNLSAAYNQINDLLLFALASLGVPVEIAEPATPAPRPDQSPCFAEPVKGELVARGKKLVGSAQFRENGAFLQHGSILVKNDQARLADLTLDAGTETSSPITLSDLLPAAISPRMMADALFEAVRKLQDAGATTMAESEIRAAALANKPFYLDPLWTWRR